jgi:hypothetical protein
MQRGYIKIWRKIEDSGLYQLPETLALFMFLLTKATHRPRRIGCLLLERGQYSSGRIELAQSLKQSEQKIRTGLDRLKKLEILTIESTKHGSVYTIVNYNNYQDNEDHPTNQLTNKQPTANQQATNEQPTANHITNTETHNTEENTYSLSSPAAPKSDPIPYVKIVDLYHRILPTLPRCLELTSKRKGQIGARWRSGNLPDLNTWERYFVFIGKSDFLMGKTDPGDGKKRFVASLEWITNESNFAKIWERKYHGNV